MAEARRSLSLLLRPPNQNYKEEVLIGHWAAKSTTRLKWRQLHTSMGPYFYEP
jgi:hypothetical protein